MSIVENEEVVVTYAANIEVQARENQEVSVTLTQQGPQGPQGVKGDMGDVTPELEALRSEVATNVSAAETVKSDVLSAREAADASAASASNDLAAVVAIQQDVVTRQTAIAAYQTEFETAKTNAQTASATSISAKDRSEEILAEVATRQAVIETAKTDAQTAATVAAASNTSVQAAKTQIDEAVVTVEDAVTATAANAQIASDAAAAAALFDPSSIAWQRMPDPEAGTSAASITVHGVYKLDAANVTTALGYPVDGEPGRLVVDDNGLVIHQEFTSDASGLMYVTHSVDGGATWADWAKIWLSSELLQVSTAEAQAGAETTGRLWSAADVKAAIDVYATTVEHVHEIADVIGLQAVLDTKANIASPALSGAPTAPTPAETDDSTRVATTAFVQRIKDQILGGASEAFDTFAELQAMIEDDETQLSSILTQLSLKADAEHTHVIDDVSGLQSALDLKAVVLSPAFTGTPTAPTATAGTSTTQIATTAFVATGLSGKANTAHVHVISDVTGLQNALDEAASTEHTHDIADVNGLQTTLNAKAPLASPTLTGTPVAPTATAGTNTTQIATTAFVATGLSGKANTSHSHAISDVTSLQTSLDAKAPLASPALTGTPTAPTQTEGNSSTRVATTAFVTVAVSRKADLSHTHAISDITSLQTSLDAKANLASPALTGTPTAPTQTEGNNSTRLATTAFVATAASRKAALSHTHAISDITSLQTSLDTKLPLTGGALTGLLTSTANIVSGLNSGGVAMTVNDGYGNANLTFNHTNGVPEQNGNAARITVNTDSPAGASIGFQLKSGVTGGTGVALTSTLTITETMMTFLGSEMWHSGNFDPSLKANLVSPALTGTPTAPTQAAGNNTTRIATTAFVTTGLSGKANSSHTHAIADVTSLQAELNAKADLSGATFTNNVSVSSANGRGFRFWNSDGYKLYMSAYADASWGGRLDSTSDYNMYFRMSGGTNRGFVFQYGSTSVGQLDGSGNMWLTGNLISTKDVYMNNRAIIANDSEGATGDRGGTNIDHIWHDEGANAWNFCSDTTYKATGNSRINAASFYAGGKLVWHAGNLNPSDFATTGADYTSSEQTITTSGLLTLSHGLGAIPSHMDGYLVCKTAEYGFAVGDRVPMGPNSFVGGGTFTSSYSVAMDSSTITVRYCSTSYVFHVINHSTGAGTVLTNANWKLVIQAWK